MGDFSFDGGPGGMGIMFTIVPIFIVIVFAAVIISLVVNGARYVKNATSEKESVYARVVSKRMDVRNHSTHHDNGNGGMHTGYSSHTYYYITLEFENGDRREYLDVKNLYGLVVEGDVGYAALKGDWIVAFERQA